MAAKITPTEPKTERWHGQSEFYEVMRQVGVNMENIYFGTALSRPVSFDIEAFPDAPQYYMRDENGGVMTGPVYISISGGAEETRAEPDNKIILKWDKLNAERQTGLIESGIYPLSVGTLIRVSHFANLAYVRFPSSLHPDMSFTFDYSLIEGLK